MNAVIITYFEWVVINVKQDVVGGIYADFAVSIDGEENHIDETNKFTSRWSIKAIKEIWAEDIHGKLVPISPADIPLC